MRDRYGPAPNEFFCLSSGPLEVLICYLDESGTPEAAGTSHFVLLGLALPATHWKRKDAEVSAIKRRYRLANSEVHTAWLMRRYPEQERIAGYTSLDDAARRRAVQKERKADLGKAALRSGRAVKTAARNYKNSADYLHLSHAERVALVRELADAIGSWEEAKLFADAQLVSAAGGPPEKLFSFAFEQVVTRLHHFLKAAYPGAVGLLVQDNNQTAAHHLTSLMRRYHHQGTHWAQIDQLVETPLFVDSHLTSMVQMADLCSYATRRFFENGETDLFDRIYGRFDWNQGKLVGLRHYTSTAPCSCRVCNDHGR